MWERTGKLKRVCTSPFCLTYICCHEKILFLSTFLSPFYVHFVVVIYYKLKNNPKNWTHSIFLFSFTLLSGMIWEIMKLKKKKSELKIKSSPVIFILHDCSISRGLLIRPKLKDNMQGRVPPRQGMRTTDLNNNISALASFPFHIKYKWECCIINVHFWLYINYQR